ncbi:hypothetical protein M413DRAFT_70449, partial [Hebeloma cylindrosporum]
MKSVTIPAQTTSLIPVHAEFPNKCDTLFVEKFIKQGELDSDLYGVPDSLISPQFSKLYVSNFSDKPIVMQAGETLGRGWNPKTHLDKQNSISEKELQLRETYAANVKRLVEESARGARMSHSTVDKIFDPSRKLYPEADRFNEPPLEGGPKTSEIPPEDVLEENFLIEIDISKELSTEKRRVFEAMLVRNRNAFGINGQLGNYPGEVEIPVIEGTKPVCIPPFGESPANREVI